MVRLRPPIQWLRRLRKPAAYRYMARRYTTNDVVWVSPVVSNATITLVTPAAYTALSFLDAAGNGPVFPTVIVHHQSGNSETNSIKIVDWFDSSPPAYIPNGRVSADT